MSMRTIIEINHDFISRMTADDFERLRRALYSSDIAGELNKGRTPEVTSGIRVLAQRFHYHPITLQVD